MPPQIENRPAAAIALKDFRKAAGFSSAAKAAAAFGWSLATYVDHESGTVRMAPEVALTYAKAFGVDAKAFASELKLARMARVRPDGPVSAAKAHEIRWNERRDGQARLVSARTLRGFESAAGFSRRLGLKNYHSYESSSQAPSDLQKVLSEILAVNFGWLRHGVFPSGLGDEVDKVLRKVPSGETADAKKLLPLAGPYSMPERERCEEMVATTVIGKKSLVRPPSKLVRVTQEMVEAGVAAKKRLSADGVVTTDDVLVTEIYRHMKSRS